MSSIAIVVSPTAPREVALAPSSMGMVLEMQEQQHMLMATSKYQDHERAAAGLGTSETAKASSRMYYSRNGWNNRFHSFFTPVPNPLSHLDGCDAAEIAATAWQQAIRGSLSLPSTAEPVTASMTAAAALENKKRISFSHFEKIHKRRKLCFEDTTNRDHFFDNSMVKSVASFGLVPNPLASQFPSLPTLRTCTLTEGPVAAAALHSRDTVVEVSSAMPAFPTLGSSLLVDFAAAPQQESKVTVHFDPTRKIGIFSNALCTDIPSSSSGIQLDPALSSTKTTCKNQCATDASSKTSSHLFNNADYDGFPNESGSDESASSLDDDDDIDKHSFDEDESSFDSDDDDDEGDGITDSSSLTSLPEDGQFSSFGSNSLAMVPYSSGRSDLELQQQQVMVSFEFCPSCPRP